MAQAKKKLEGGAAGRLAAGRRPGRGAPERGDKPSKAVKGGKGGLKGKAKKASSASPLARAFKLVVLLGFMALLGFALVLIVDVGANLAGSVKFGDITFRDLFDKVEDRVFDRDVPEPKKRPQAPKKTTTSTPAKAPPEPTRAPQQAPSPEDYAKHVEPRPDPEVEQAKQRLDQLLKGL